MKSHPSSLRLALLAAILAWLTASVSTTHAVSRSFTAAVSNDWMVAGNWQPSGAPDATDDVEIAAGKLASLGTDTSVASLTLRGTLEGSGSLSVSGTLRWGAGTMRGSGTTMADGGIVLAGTEPRHLERPLTLGAQSMWQDGGSLRISGTGTLLLRAGALLQITADVEITAGSGSPHFENDGTIAKTAGNGLLSIGTIRFDNHGSLVIETGGLQLHSDGSHRGSFQAAGGHLDFRGGTHDLTSTASITGGDCRFLGAAVDHNGLYEVTDTRIEAGSVAWRGPVQPLGDVQLTGGVWETHASNGLVQIQTYTQSGGVHDGRSVEIILGPMHWSGGELIGFGITNANGGLTIAGDDALTLSRLLTNFGSGVWRATGFLLIGDGGLLVNRLQSTMNIETPILIFTAGLAPRVANEGTLRHVATGNSELNGVGFENSGTVELQSGTWRFTTSYIQSAGATLLHGGRLRVDQPLRLEGGVLGGNGILDGAVESTGTITVGPAATLQINGPYTQRAGGSLQVGIAGTDQARMGSLRVAAADLAGRLTLSWVDDYMPVIGDSYAFLRFSSVTGSFSMIDLPPVPLAADLELRLGSDSMRLVVTERDCSTPSSCVGTPTPSASPTATATPLPCTGDCNTNGSVSSEDLLAAITAALENDGGSCAVLDHDGSGAIEIDELVRAVGSAQRGC